MSSGPVLSLKAEISSLLTLPLPTLIAPHVLSPLEDIEDTDGQVAEAKTSSTTISILAVFLELASASPQPSAGPRLGLCTQALPLVLQLD